MIIGCSFGAIKCCDLGFCIMTVFWSDPVTFGYGMLHCNINISISILELSLVLMFTFIFYILVLTRDQFKTNDSNNLTNGLSPSETTYSEFSRCWCLEDSILLLSEDDQCRSHSCKPRKRQNVETDGGSCFIKRVLCFLWITYMQLNLFLIYKKNRLPVSTVQLKAISPTCQPRAVFATSRIRTCSLLEVILLGSGSAPLSADCTEEQLSPAELMAM